MKRVHLLLTLFALTAIFGGVVMRQQYMVAQAVSATLINGDARVVAANSLFCAFFPKSAQCKTSSSSSSSVSSSSKSSSKSSAPASSSKSSVSSTVSSSSKSSSVSSSSSSRISSSSSVSSSSSRVSSTSSISSSSSSLHGAPLGAGDYDFSLQSSGTKRRYMVHVPSSYNGTKMPLVMVLHGGGGNAENAIYSYGFNATSDTSNFIVAYPEGTGSLVTYGKISGSWNAGTCCGESALKQVDDVSFISSMIDDVSAKFAIDASRVYATGFSNGAMMSYRLACDLSGKIAAIAPVGGQMGVVSCNMTRPVSVLHIHGTDDPCALFNGSTDTKLCGGCLQNYYRAIGIPTSGDGTFQCTATATAIDTYRKILLLDTPVTNVLMGSVSCQRFATAQAWLSNSFLTQNPIAPWGDLNVWKQRLASTEILFCPVVGMGHTWPSPSPHYDIQQCNLACDTKTCSAAEKNAYDTYCVPYKNAVGSLSTAVDANKEIWKFFSAHTRN